MNNSNKILLFVLISVAFVNCSRIKNKTEHLTDKVKSKTKRELKKQTDKVVDKVFPPFDSDKADTDNNKRRFKDFIKVELTEDIKNIYCFDDAIGIDADYMFSFNCDSLTSVMIIKIHNLTRDTNNSDNGFNLQHDFEWWDKDRISKLNKYSWTDGGQYYKYYWYDKENKKAYYFELDM